MQDSYRLRFLRARKFDYALAAKMLREHIEYKEAARPDEVIIEPGSVRLNKDSAPLKESKKYCQMALSGVLCIEYHREVVH